MVERPAAAATALQPVRDKQAHKKACTSFLSFISTGPPSRPFITIKNLETRPRVAFFPTAPLWS